MCRFRFGLIAVAALMGALAAPAAAAPPTNDLFEAATPLGDAPVEIAGTTRGASRQPGEPLDALQIVWYAFRPTTGSRVAVEVSPIAGPSDRVLGVYTGPAPGALNAIGTHAGVEARVAFETVAGETYWIAVGRSWQSGPFTLRIRPMPLPPNDAFHDALTVGVPSIHAGNLADATAELGEPDEAHSVWYRFRPRRSGSYWVEATGTCAQVAIFRGSSVDDLLPVHSGSAGYRLRRGRIYHAAVTCYGVGFGDYGLRISDGSIEGDGVELAVDPGQTVDGVRGRGLRLTVSAARSVAVAVQLRVSGRTARQLGLDNRVIGRLEGRVSANVPRTAAVRLTREARRALDGESELRATLRLELPDSTAPDRFLDVRVRL